ncbi:glycosyltransferase [Salinibacter ruber]|uniref:glycosyltransferase n=1 Tax=Salinibacter ruber TaxID=146919 RepID=UPI0013C33217|nr:glycosyltransferase [Salinibacter ruber]
MHRVRHSLPYFREFGWRATVLAVEPSRVEGERDERLCDTLPSDADVRRVEALPQDWTRQFKIGNLALRAFPYYLRRGSEIIHREGIDLVYFSTTAFPILTLGRYWKARFGVPYVIDMQDPWYSGTYDPGEEPAMFSKAWLARQLGRILEPIAMSGVDGIISVSEGYCDILQTRYSRVTASRCAVIPFGASQNDFDVLEETEVRNPVFDPNDGSVHIAQVGRAGPDMDRAAHALFDALSRGRQQHPELYGDVRLHFVGTRYSSQASKTIEPIAAEYNVADIVEEQVTRVPYFQALRILCDADMLLLLGSTDPNYTASKLYPYILARRPLLTVFHENSSVVPITRETGAGTVVTYDNRVDTDTIADQVEGNWSSMLRRLPFTPATDWNAFQPYTAEAMTRRQVTVFDEVVD